MLVGNPAMAVAAAAGYANRSGWGVAEELQREPGVTAEQAAESMVQWMCQQAATREPRAMISGGEPIVRVKAHGGRGGRNTHLALAALNEIIRRVKAGDGCELLRGSFALLSAASDGEDGTAGACGAFIDDRIVRRVLQDGPDAEAFLSRYDSSEFFRVLQDGLLIRSPAAMTNVCDLRIALVGPQANSAIRSEVE